MPQTRKNRTQVVAAAKIDVEVLLIEVSPPNEGIMLIFITQQLIELHMH